MKTRAGRCQTRSSLGANEGMEELATDIPNQLCSAGFTGRTRGRGGWWCKIISKVSQGLEQCLQTPTCCLVCKIHCSNWRAREEMGHKVLGISVKWCKTDFYCSVCTWCARSEWCSVGAKAKEDTTYISHWKTTVKTNKWKKQNFNLDSRVSWKVRRLHKINLKTHKQEN